MSYEKVVFLRGRAKITENNDASWFPRVDFFNSVGSPLFFIEGEDVIPLYEPLGRFGSGKMIMSPDHHLGTLLVGDKEYKMSLLDGHFCILLAESPWNDHKNALVWMDRPSAQKLITALETIC